MYGTCGSVLVQQSIHVYCYLQNALHAMCKMLITGLSSDRTAPTMTIYMYIVRQYFIATK